jgi:alpha-mannosidase
MTPWLTVMLVGWTAAFAQAPILEKPAAAGWRTSVDGDVPGAQQAVETVTGPNLTWLKWMVVTNRDGKFTGYGLQRDVAFDLSRFETLRWRWKTSGSYLQMQFWAGDKLAYWDAATLPSGRWRTETVALAQFHFLGGFEATDWARVTRIGLRIADSFAGYQEGAAYELGLAFLHGYEAIGPPAARPPAADGPRLEETAKALTVGSNRYRIELSKERLSLQLYLPDGDRLAAVSPSGLFYGFDVDKGHSFDARPVYEVVEQSPGRVVIAAAAELPLASHDAVLITFTCMGDRFYTAVKYHTPLDSGYLAARFAPSGDAAKGLFDSYGFRDEAGRLHRGSFAEYEARAGFGLSTFDADGDFVRAFSGEKPYLFLWKSPGGRGLAMVYLDYDQQWRGSVDNCHFCYYTPQTDYFHLGLASGCDCAPTRAACFYVDVAGDLPLVDQVIVPEILAEAKSLALEARVPKGFTIRTDRGDARRAVLAKMRETWGNHMHWIGCGWGRPGGDDVLATSVDLTERMLALGAAGAVNFDMVGVERLVTERPAAIEKLKRLLATGRLEVAGATYGQPLGNLHGAESNVRQLQWGVRVCERYLGVSPKTWWEEEFYFFPQLPQLLRLTGFDGACLYFQRTWMDPSFPHEEGTSVVRWQAPDGSQIRTAAHTPLSRWMPTNPQPAALADSPFAKRAVEPLIVDWNELAETDAQLADQYRPAYQAMARFGVKPTTLARYLGSYRGPAPARAYRMDETFTGLPLGKCGDQVRRSDKRIENALTAAEALGAGASLGGVTYPAEALTEAWKNLLIFQGHDVHICEGCLRGAYPQYMEAAEKGARQALDGVIAAAAGKVDTRKPDALAAVIVFNPLAWQRGGVVEIAAPGGLAPADKLAVQDDAGALSPVQRVEGGRLLFVARDVPAVGYRTFWLVARDAAGDVKVSADGTDLSNAAIRAKLDGAGALRGLRVAEGGEELLSADTANGELRATIGGRGLSSSACKPSVKVVEAGPVRAVVEARGSLTDRVSFVNRTIVYSGLAEVAFETNLQVEEHLDGLMSGALRRVFTPAFRAAYFHDWPFGVSETRMTNEFTKYFPFPGNTREEKVRNHVSGLNFLDCQGEKAGLLYAHDGNQGFLRAGAEIANLLSLYDPWDGDYYPTRQSFRSALIAHGPWRNSDRLRAAIGFNTPLPAVMELCRAGSWPGAASWLGVGAGGALVSGFYRDGRYLIVRLYDVDGARGRVRVALPIPASARVVDLLGRPLETLKVLKGGVSVSLTPFQIATVRLTPAR